jgi:hypothetical protein
MQHERAGSRLTFLLRWGLPAVAVCLASLLASLPCQAQISSTEEYRLKLAFLYNFAKFVEWPADSFASPQAPLNICIVGRDPFDSELEQQMAKRSCSGHPYAVRRLRAADDLSVCHIVFLPAGNDTSLPLILQRLNDSGAIVVGESAGFARRGGTVNFIIEGTRLRFEVNLDASRRKRSRIGSRLLALARIVRPSQP